MTSPNWAPTWWIAFFNLDLQRPIETVYLPGDGPTGRDRVCPIHDTIMVYWPRGGQYACQDPDCEYAHGV